LYVDSSNTETRRRVDG